MSSSDPSVASVVVAVFLNPFTAGTATITATSSNGLTAYCAVTVNPVLAESLTLSPDFWTGEKGSTFTITATILPDNTSDKSLLWESSDDNIATVTEEGTVNVLNEGECTIIVSTLDGSNLRAECKITGISGIEQIFTDPDVKVNVCNLNGVIIKRDCSRDDLQQLQPGIYIILQPNGKNIVFLNR